LPAIFASDAEGDEETSGSDEDGQGLNESKIVLHPGIVSEGSDSPTGLIRCSAGIALREVLEDLVDERGGR